LSCGNSARDASAGLILGGLLGVIWTNGQQIQIDGVALSLAALAFFVGYSDEIVFEPRGASGMRRTTSAAVCAVLCTAIARAGRRQIAAPPAAMSDGWPVSSPAQQGRDLTAVRRSLHELRTASGLIWRLDAGET
jgi:hypothetical protein